MSKNEVMISKEEAELRKIFSSDRLNDYLDNERKKLEDKLIDEAEYKNTIDNLMNIANDCNKNGALYQNLYERLISIQNEVNGGAVGIDNLYQVIKSVNLIHLILEERLIKIEELVNSQ